MLSDLTLKHSFTTLQSQSKLQCNCGNCNSELVIDKLEQILSSLYSEAAAKNKEVEQLKRGYESKIKEKDEVIERVTFANAKLTDENQMLSQLLKLEKCKNRKSQIQFASAQKLYETKLRQIQSIKTYLETKNQEYRSEIAAIQSLIPKQQYSLKKSCTPPTFRLFEPTNCYDRRLISEADNLRSNQFEEKYYKLKERYLNPQKESLTSNSRRSSIAKRKNSKSDRKEAANSNNVKFKIPIATQKK